MRTETQIDSFPLNFLFCYNFPLQRSYYSWCLPISGGKNSQHLRLLSPITCDKDHKILGTAKHLQPWRGQPAVLRDRTIASDFEVLFFSPATLNLAVLSNTPHSDCTKRSYPWISQTGSETKGSIGFHHTMRACLILDQECRSHFGDIETEWLVVRTKHTSEPLYTGKWSSRWTVHQHRMITGVP